ncbi:hypothetical protein M0813_01389 [Anaeramoeba flamelloides]|uniref:Uncharacterized protein n=1 Tax=Anaeramoeba flamelloides TaxID=1746091 RepID=A0ABQ8Z8Y2_9EUKA|nr:hypothetical protein M0813_01389 [Anaeramoeba flamelloides]
MEDDQNNKENNLKIDNEPNNSNSSQENDSNNTDLIKQSSCSELVIDKRMIEKITNQVKEKMKNKYEKQIRNLKQAFVLKEKIYKKEVYQLKEEVARRLSALENSNVLRDEIVYQKRELLLINKQLRETIGNVKSKNLILELQNTKLKNQIKRQENKTNNKNGKVSSSNINNGQDNENSGKNLKTHIVNNTKNEMYDNDNKTEIEDQNKIELEKKLKKKYKKRNDLERSTSLLKMYWDNDQTEVSFSVLGNRKQQLIRNDLGMKKSWSIADMELKESQKKIRENLWTSNLGKMISQTPTTMKKNNYNKDLLLLQQLENEKSLTKNNKSLTNNKKKKDKQKRKKRKLLLKLRKKKKKNKKIEKTNKDKN